MLMWTYWSQPASSVKGPWIAALKKLKKEAKRKIKVADIAELVLASIKAD